MESDVDYLRRRAVEEQQRAAEASDDRIASIHARMAALYADRAAALDENPDFDPIVQIRQKPQPPTSSR